MQYHNMKHDNGNKLNLNKQFTQLSDIGNE